LNFIESELERMQKPVEKLVSDPRYKPIIDELTQECGVGVLAAMVYRARSDMRAGFAGDVKSASSPA
jgi:hypothetical protein